MQSFTDRSGRSWTLSLTLGLARRLAKPATPAEGEEPRKPIDVLDPKSLQETLDDLWRRFDLLFALATASNPDVTADEFDAGIADSETFAAANTALLAELTDFFHRAGQKALARIVEHVIAASERLDNLAVTKVDGPKMQRAIDKILDDAGNQIDAGIDEELAKLESESVSQ